MTSVTGQVGPLFRLRWTMVRSRRVRLGLVLLGCLVPALGAGAVLLTTGLPEEQRFRLGLVTPTLMLAFLVLAVLAPLTAGGGYELYPADQLVAYPITPRTTFLSMLLLVPVNLAWVLNVLGLLAAGAALTGVHRGLGPMLVTMLAYVALVTVTGQALAWLVVGLRQTRRGRLGVWTAAAALAVVVALAVRLDWVSTALDYSPTRWVLGGGLDGANGRYTTWLLGLVVMAVGVVVALRGGVTATAWAARRPGDQGVQAASRPVRRRPAQHSVLLELVAVDHASVWRSVPLRRGILVLLVLPGAVSAVAAMEWQSVVLLPGLVAAGAGLLFGVNAFCLDAGGATWLATLPGWGRRAFTAKALVVAEVAALSVTTAVVAAALRAPAPGSAADLTAVVASGASCVVLVVATSMRLSVRRPHRADLRGSRDTPAPPGTMAVYSVRLAVMTTFVGLAFTGASFSRTWWVPLVLAVPMLAWAGLSLVDSARAWGEPARRAAVVATVAGG